MPDQLNPKAWVDEYADELFSFIIKRTGNSSYAEDILQEVFLSAWRSRNTYNGSTTERNWLFAICKNKIVDHYRKQAESRTIVAIDGEADDHYFLEDGHWRPEVKPGGGFAQNEQQLDRKDFFQMLERCKKKLKEIQERVFTLKHIEDMDTTEICETLSITVENYWVLMHRAKINLRTCLEKNWKTV